MLCSGQSTRKEFAHGTAYRHVLGVVGKTLDRAKSFGNTLGLIGKLEKQLGANCIASQRRTDGALLASNRTCSALNHKVVEVVPTHELENLTAQGGLLFAKLAHLGLKCADLIV
jgi:hypothetical protein